MSLTTCPECRGKVSTKAAACPHCGAPVDQRTGAHIVQDQSHSSQASPVSPAPKPPAPVPASAQAEPAAPPYRQSDAAQSRTTPTRQRNLKDPSTKFFVSGGILLVLAFFAVVGFAAICGQAWDAKKNATARDWYDGSAFATQKSYDRMAYTCLFAAAPLSIAAIISFIIGFGKRSSFKAYLRGIEQSSPSTPEPSAASDTRYISEEHNSAHPVAVDNSVAAAQIAAPAVLITILAAISCLLGLVNVVLGLIASADDSMMLLIAFLPGVIAAIGNGVAFWGGLSMKRLKRYRLAFASNIIIMLPLTYCCILGLPLGIWGLNILSKPEIKDAFK